MQQAFLTVDLGFGDAGKGSIVDFLTRTYGAHTVIRYNGGAQAGHRVVTPAGPGMMQQEHVFAQFGAGTLAGAATHLSRFMLLDPLAMMAEEAHLQTLGITDAFQRTTIDARAVVITPFQRAVNRVREALRGAGRHGSCGMGIGETAADRLAHGDRVLLAGDLVDRDRLYTKLAFLRAVNLAKVHPYAAQIADCAAAAAEMAWLADPDWEWLLAAYADFAALAQFVPGSHLSALLARPGAVIFEGAQGVLLDEWFGFHPHTTWSTTTLANAEQLLAEASYPGNVTRIGITRAYATRHGAGPFVTEDATLTEALPDACNGNGAWQQGFRVGWLDLMMVRYALAAVGPLDYLAVTCLDRLAGLTEVQLCQHYHDDTGCWKQTRSAPTPHDLGYQAQLTHRLQRCRPHLQALPDCDALCTQLTARLGVPTRLLSHGPTAAEKQLWPL